jgi:hypothetical protein
MDERSIAERSLQRLNILKNHLNVDQIVENNSFLETQDTLATSTSA